MSKLTIMLVAFFIGNETPIENAYVFQKPIYESYQACLKDIDENYHVLNYFLSTQFGHPTRLYRNHFYCTTADEVKKLLESGVETKPQI